MHDPEELAKVELPDQAEIGPSYYPIISNTCTRPLLQNSSLYLIAVGAADNCQLILCGIHPFLH